MQGSGGHVYLPDGQAQLKLGNSEDLKIYHNSTDSVIDNETGDLSVNVQAIDVDQLILKSVGTTEIRKHSGK